MTEELENSLQQAVETYLNDRLRAINEEVARLQTEVSEALERLRESSGPQTLEGTALSAAIFAHLQTARGQRLSGATSPAPRGDVRAIRRAVESIEQQQSQTDVLKSLLSGAVEFAERVALFVIKNEQAIGWRVCNAGDPANLEMIGGVSLPISADTIVTRAAKSRSSLSAQSGSNSEEHLLLDQLGGNPQAVMALPLIVRGKVVAVLYADSASAGEGAINSDALEVLARVAALGVNLVSIQRPPTRPEAPRSPEAATVEEAPRAEAPQTYAPEIEPRMEEAVAPAAEETSAPSAPPAEAPPVEPVATQPEVVREELPAQATTAAPTIQPETTEPPPPAFVTEYATPLGSARRFGVREPELPIEVSEEERRLHNDARRFARLLVSEIKLYNEPKVKEGRSNGDLYDRLREDIDRSRQMYDKRVAPPVAARHDYFHQELVNTLAEGDEARLGASYPGSVAVS